MDKEIPVKIFTMTRGDAESVLANYFDQQKWLKDLGGVELAGEDVMWGDIKSKHIAVGSRIKNSLGCIALELTGALTGMAVAILGTQNNNDMYINTGMAIMTASLAAFTFEFCRVHNESYVNRPDANEEDYQQLLAYMDLKSVAASNGVDQALEHAAGNRIDLNIRKSLLSLLGSEELKQYGGSAIGADEIIKIAMPLNLSSDCTAQDQFETSFSSALLRATNSKVRASLAKQETRRLPVDVVRFEII